MHRLRQHGGSKGALWGNRWGNRRENMSSTPVTYRLLLYDIWGAFIVTRIRRGHVDSGLNRGSVQGVPFGACATIVTLIKNSRIFLARDACRIGELAG